MKRLWDIIIGIFMIVASLICQAIVFVFLVGFLCAAIAERFNLHGNGWIWCVEIAAAILLNALTFYEFRRQTRQHRMLGSGGGFFLLPRGLYRIVYGRETYAPQQLNKKPPALDSRFEVFPISPSGQDRNE